MVSERLRPPVAAASSRSGSLGLLGMRRDGPRVTTVKLNVVLGRRIPQSVSACLDSHCPPGLRCTICFVRNERAKRGRQNEPRDIKARIDEFLKRFSPTGSPVPFPNRSWESLRHEGVLFKDHLFGDLLPSRRKEAQEIFNRLCHECWWDPTGWRRPLLAGVARRLARNPSNRSSEWGKRMRRIKGGKHTQRRYREQGWHPLASVRKAWGLTAERPQM